MPLEFGRVEAALAELYIVKGEIGRGGMAAVYLADDLKHRRQVAIKVLEPELAATVGADRFLREIELAAGLEHPHILPVFDSGESDGLLFYVMPHVQGESLQQRLERVGALPLDQALAIAREVADGLAYAHRHGVVHRDIKPGNILLSDGHARIADFGVARPVDVEGTTKTGLILGSPLYMSPEQAAGETVDGHSDIYSLGCVTYEMLAGKAPFGGASVQAILVHQMIDTPTQLTDVRDGIPPHVANAISRCLAKDPEERFANADELRRELEISGASGQSLAIRRPARSVPQWPRWLGRRRSLLGVGVVVLVLAGLAATVGKDRFVPRAAESAPVGAQQSFAVPTFRAASDDAEDQQLADKAAFELAVLLRGWDDLRVANRYRLEGIGRKLGLAIDSLVTIEDGLRVAGEAGMGTLLLGELSTFGDSVRVVVYPYDVRSGQEIQGRSLQETGSRSELAHLLSVIAKRVAALSVETDLSTFDLQNLSTELGAIETWLQGQEELERWRLQHAERSFRLAIQRDSAFALPYHYLALTLSWQDDFNPRRRISHQDEILELAATSVRLANTPGVELPWRERMRLTAFHSLKNGDFDRARVLYDSVLAHDAMDHEAWVQRGVVEYDDGGLVEYADELLPRKNLNLAIRAFRRAVELRPAAQIGYGRLFDVYHDIPRYAAGGWCYGFEPPDRRTNADEVRRPEEQLYYCPTWVDSIDWMASGDPELAARKDVIVKGANARRDSSFQLLREWAAVAPDVARPHVLLSQLFEERRGEAGEALDVVAVQDASDSALLHLIGAVNRTDSALPEEFVSLGMLYLAAGDVELATELTERGLAAVDSLAPGDSISALPQAANVFLAQGRIRRSIEVANAYSDPQIMAALDPSGRMVPFGGAEPILREIHLLAAAGRGGVALDSAFARLWRLWSQPTYTEAEITLLAANAATVKALTPAMTVHDAGRREWLSRLKSIPPMWRAFESESEAGTALAVAGVVRTAANAISKDSASRALDSYVLGLAAQRVGEDSLAITLWERLDAAAASVRQTDATWALRVLTYLWRARSYERLSQTDSAVAYYTRFSSTWSNADPELRSVVTEARDASDRLVTQQD